MKTVAIIQARMGSTRLPGKVLMDLGGQPVLAWAARAARAAPGVDEVWIATSMLPADDAIVAFCRERAINFFRGSETDVLDRFWQCALAAIPDYDPPPQAFILRLTGDCPFLDPHVIGGVVRLLKEEPYLGVHDADYRYCSNVSPRTYPDGLDVEGFTIATLGWAHRHATREIDRDCVTSYIGRNRHWCPADALINPISGLAGERWVLDTADDYEFCKGIARYWPWDAGPPSMLDILGVLDRYPELRDLNKNHPVNERFYSALAEEPVYRRSYERSQAQFEKARKVIPLGAQTFSKSHVQFPQPSPLFVSHGRGGMVWDIDGNEYVDLVSALLPNILGYCDPDVDTAIRRQLSAGISFSLATELEAKLAETLCRLIPCAEAVRFGKTGTDVTTAAIRLARAHTGRDRVLICGGYHGWADWSVERNLGVPEDVRKLTTRCSWNMLPAIACSDFAAVIVEPESNNKNYLNHLRDFCDKYGAVLIFDEVITGFRFDLGGAQKLFGVTPDLATFGKSMANGMPISAIVGKRSIMKRMEPPDNIFYSGTFFGETLSIAAAIATINKLENGAFKKMWDAGSRLMTDVTMKLHDHGVRDVIETSGWAPFMRLKFKDDKIAAIFRREMIATGTLIIASHNISAAHGPNEIKRVLKSYDHALGILRDALDKGDIDERLAGASVAPMVRQ